MGGLSRTGFHPPVPAGHHTSRAQNPATGEWNDTLTGDLLWTNANFSEAIPDVMTPCTWSWWGWLHTATLPLTVSGHSITGNIGGRAYANLTFLLALYGSAGMDATVALRNESETFGGIPAGVAVPLLPVSRMESLRCLFGFLRTGVLMFLASLRAPRVVTQNRDWCCATRERIASSNTGAELCRLWDTVIAPYAVNLFWVLKGVTQSYESKSAFRKTLSGVIGEDGVNALLSNLRGEEAVLASLGPVTGLARVVSGDMTEAEYLEAYGHRGPHEAELGTPRPAEDPTWLMREMDEARRNPIDVDSLLQRQLARHRAAVERLKSGNPSLARAVLRKVDAAAEAARLREAVRSEVVRASWVARDWAIKAGRLTGLAEGIFFLGFPEIEQVLMGDDRARDYIEPRKATYRTYCSLPPYPAVICGRFDPVQWAKSPDRRSDLFDSHAPSRPAGKNEAMIRGFPGAGGRVQARVRRLASPEESYLLQPGEVLVTPTTNVGWTLLFPRCAAVVTDVGAPLSHAAIVARELGIPAVVGCGDATMRLHTGDLVSVDGGLGVVELVDQVSERTGADFDATTSTPVPRIS